jgi:hypothetical protein
MEKVDEVWLREGPGGHCRQLLLRPGPGGSWPAKHRVLRPENIPLTTNLCPILPFQGKGERESAPTFALWRFYTETAHSSARPSRVGGSVWSGAILGCAWWHLFVILAFRRMRQEDCENQAQSGLQSETLSGKKKSCHGWVTHQLGDTPAGFSLTLSMTH